VDYTNGRVFINATNQDSLPIVPYILQLNAGDYIEFAAQTDGIDDSDCQILSQVSPFGTVPSIPSISVGVKRVG
jgi:hypothetical protein